MQRCKTSIGTLPRLSPGRSGVKARFDSDDGPGHRPIVSPCHPVGDRSQHEPFAIAGHVLPWGVRATMKVPAPIHPVAKRLASLPRTRAGAHNCRSNARATFRVLYNCVHNGTAATVSVFPRGENVHPRARGQTGSHRPLGSHSRATFPGPPYRAPASADNPCSPGSRRWLILSNRARLIQYCAAEGIGQFCGKSHGAAYSRCSGAGVHPRPGRAASCQCEGPDEEVEGAHVAVQR
jgi:hypothetical protein